MDREDIEFNNKRIAKNTLLLYFRMLFLMCISLYTSRVLLFALGIDDFGVYNVVGGVVSMFSILSGSLSAAIGRFITYELGAGNKERLTKIFSSAVTVQILLGLIIILLAETIGMWFLNTKMIIPAERLIAANWVLQFSILTFVVNIVSIPYNATIIAHEKMSAFAYISIVEAVGKLAIAYFVTISPMDKLIFYAISMFSIAILIRLIYGVYCKLHFEECTYQFFWDKELLQDMFGFAGWNFIGASSAILKDQGVNIVINMFCGTAVNAARGIAIQVNGAIYNFVQNFMTALNPQITKSYAIGDKKYMMSLIFQGARLSYYILLVLALPVIINTEYVLQVWLIVVPEHTVRFVKLVLLFSLSESISMPLITAMLATGNIRNYQIVVGGLQVLNLPLAYLLLKMSFEIESVFVTAIIISQACLVARLYMLRSIICLKARDFVSQVYINVVVVSIVSAIVPFWLHSILDAGTVSFMGQCVVTIVLTLLVEFYIGCTTNEREFVRNKVRKIINNQVDRNDRDKQTC